MPVRARPVLRPDCTVRGATLAQEHNRWWVPNTLMSSPIVRHEVAHHERAHGLEVRRCRSCSSGRVLDARPPPWRAPQVLPVGCEARGSSPRDLRSIRGSQARGKAGRVNVNEPLMTPRNRQPRRWDARRGDKAWPLVEGASGGRRDRTGRESTAGPRGKEGTQSGRDSGVRNVETLPGPGAGRLVGRP